jgi:hypothetical protein
MCFQVFVYYKGSSAFNSRIYINLDCHVLRVQAFDFSNVCSFFTEPESVVQLYSAILPQVKRVHKFVLDNVRF